MQQNADTTRKADGVYIVLNDVFIRVINGAMTRPLDYDYLKNLPPAPQRFYELLSYQMYAALKYDRARAKLTYSDFCAHAPQTRHCKWNNARSQMSKIHRPHRESGYIAGVDFQATLDSEGRPDWIMLYQPGPRAREEFKAFTKRGGSPVLEIAPVEPVLQLPFSDLSDVEAELVKRGIRPAIAKELATEHVEEKLLKQIEIFDWLLQKKPEKFEDPAAYLVRAIKDDYAAPPRYVSKAERERRESAKQQAERGKAEDYSRKQAEAARERAEIEQADACWQSLNPQELSALDAELEANIDPAMLALQTGPLKNTGRIIRRREHFRRVLQAEGKFTLTSA